MRFFIALHIPPQNQLEIEHAQNELLKIIPEARLTNSEKLHVTIAFLGEQPAEMQQHIEAVIKEAVLNIPPFELTPGYVDGFPNLHHPHTLWIGVKDEVDKLFLLRERIKDGLSEMNEPVDERRFVPHIAIAKLPDLIITEQQEQQLEALLQQPFSPIKITSVKLYQSEPQNQFHTHNILAEINLSEQSN